MLNKTQLFHTQVEIYIYTFNLLVTYEEDSMFFPVYVHV